MNRKCKKCGNIDFGIWGTVGVIGYSLIVGALGYAMARIFFSYNLPLVLVIFGIIFILPVWFISFHEERKITCSECGLDFTLKDVKNQTDTNIECPQCGEILNKHYESHHLTDVDDYGQKEVVTE